MSRKAVSADMPSSATTTLGPTPTDQTSSHLHLSPTLGGRVRADGTLNHFSASCGHEIVRGDRLPQDLRGDVLLPEPVGRLIRRGKISNEDGVTVSALEDGGGAKPPTLEVTLTPGAYALHVRAAEKGTPATIRVGVSSHS